MAKKINELDYLNISAQIHARENRLLTRERRERMLDARSTEEAAKVLSECGYSEFSDLTPASIEHVLAEARHRLMDDLRKSVPDPSIVDIFSIQYDYHNAKVLLKARATGQNPEDLLIDAGRYPVSELREEFLQGDLHRQSPIFIRGVTEAGKTLSLTGDPQAADLVLDRAYYEEMLTLARETGSDFLVGYVKLSIDCVNLRSTVRAHRMGREADFLRRVLLPGGDLSIEGFIAAGTGAVDLTTVVGSGLLAKAAEAGARVMGGGSLTKFERLCDDAQTAYLSKAKQVPFGEHPLIGYLYARSAELTAIRIILTGRLAGLDSDTIRERLRESYV